MKKLRGILIAAGIFIIFGTAGSSDIGTISLGQTALQCAMGSIMILVGGAL
jgi:hypothetical protein